MDVDEKTQTDSEPVGFMGFIVGFLSFIPGIGVAFSIVGLIWSSKVRNNTLRYIVLFSLMLNVLGLGYFYYKSYIEVGGKWDRAREQVAKQNMYTLVKKIESYKKNNALYPKSLKIIAYSLPELQRIIVFDATLWHKRSNIQFDVTDESLFLYYEIININEGFHLRARGRDGIFGTEDDVLIESVDGTGFVHDHQI